MATRKSSKKPRPRKPAAAAASSFPDGNPQAPKDSAIGKTSPAAPAIPAGKIEPRLGRVHLPRPTASAAYTAGEGAAEPAAPARKGQAFCFVKTSKGLFPLTTLLKAEINRKNEAASRQIQTEAKYMTAHGLVPPPFDLTGLLNLMENCSYFDACCRQIARDVVGQGFDLTLRDGLEKENEAEKTATEEFLNSPADESLDTIEDIIEKMIIDYESIGWMGLEVARGEDGQVSGLYHVPAHTIRVHKSGDKYCQDRGGNDKVWFKRYGLEGEISTRSGEPLREKTKIDEDGTTTTRPVNEDLVANELIFIARYYQRSTFYGAPPILPAVGSVTALVGIRDYNLAFFENYGIPAAIVTLTGDWEEEAIADISNFIDVEIKGSGNQHKTVVLNPPLEGTVKWEPLIVEVKEGHFKLYSRQLRDDVLVCYNMPPYRIGIAESGSLGGNLATEATRIYVTSTVNPMKRLTERFVTRRILQEGREVKDYEFWWEDLDTRDLDAIVDRMTKLFGVGAANRNEIREEVGREHLEEGEGGDDFYLGNNYVPVNEAGLAPAEEGTALGAQVGNLQAKVDKAIADIQNGGKNAIHRTPDGAGGRDSDEDDV